MNHFIDIFSWSAVFGFTPVLCAIQVLVPGYLGSVSYGLPLTAWASN